MASRCRSNTGAYKDGRLPRGLLHGLGNAARHIPGPCVEQGIMNRGEGFEDIRGWRGQGEDENISCGTPDRFTFGRHIRQGQDLAFHPRL
jgi:hypothetical protein